MSKRNYTHIQALLPEIEEMVSNGMTQREIAEHLGVKDRYVVKELLKRERRKERKIKAGIVPLPKGRPSNDPEKEIERLKMENKLLRDFLRLSERM